MEGGGGAGPRPQPRGGPVRHGLARSLSSRCSSLPRVCTPRRIWGVSGAGMHMNRATRRFREAPDGARGPEEPAAHSYSGPAVCVSTRSPGQSERGSEPFDFAGKTSSRCAGDGNIARTGPHTVAA